MRIKSSSLLPFCAVVALGLSAGGARSQAYETCAPMEIYSDGANRAVEFIDLGEAGPSVGDMRIGKRRLLDGDGNEVGQIRWTILSLNNPDEPGATIEISSVAFLDSGKIYLKNHLEITGDIDDTTKVSAPDLKAGIVLGGTGVFSGARGTYSVADDGLNALITIDMSCR